MRADLVQAKSHLDAINNYNPKELNYSRLFSCLVKIVEDQEKEIKLLNRKVSSLNNRISSIGARY